MKKIFIVLLLITLLTGCSKEQNNQNENIINENSCSVDHTGC